MVGDEQNTACLVTVQKEFYERHCCAGLASTRCYDEERTATSLLKRFGDASDDFSRYDHEKLTIRRESSVGTQTRLETGRNE